MFIESSNILYSVKFSNYFGLLLHFISFFIKYSSVQNVKSTKQILKKSNSNSAIARANALKLANKRTIPWVSLSDL